jgi:hypothetical protein
MEEKLIYKEEIYFEYTYNGGEVEL